MLVAANLLQTVGAHPTQLSRLTLRLERAVVVGELQANAFDLGEATGLPRLADPLGVAVAAEVAAQRTALGQFVARALTLRADHTVCPVTSTEFETRASFVHARMSWRCTRTDSALAIESRLFHAIDPAARLVVIVEDTAGNRQSLLDAHSPRWSLRQAAPRAAVLIRYMRAGIEHIFIGADHIAFLIGIILWGRRAGPLVKTVTAFTLAHSVTLGLAVLDLVRIPSAYVEAAIALSILYVAIQNFFVREQEGRWRVAGLLGLIHGLGFASALRDYGLPAEALGWALGAFNVGVELGQLAIVLCAVALLRILDRWLGGTRAAPARSPAVVWTGSLLIGALGLYWLLERTGVTV